MFYGEITKGGGSNFYFRRILYARGGGDVTAQVATAEHRGGTPPGTHLRGAGCTQDTTNWR